uniref:DUF4817 domain-containing protein n=1 Tax=Acrobeloides nanus TaxID=290746 RepID=A0A914E0G4_9BILA
KAQCVVWFAQMGSPVAVQRQYARHYGLEGRAAANVPDSRSIKRWYDEYLERGHGKDLKKPKNWLDEHFRHRWMGRGSWNLPWPPYSPDLLPTHCDFFLWGYIKSIVYRTQPQNLDELQARIQDAFDNLPQEMIDRAIECYERRLQRCIDVDGRNVEQNYADEGNFLP